MSAHEHGLGAVMISDHPSPSASDWQHQISLRFRDLDYLGHVTAAEYLAMFEEGRAAWLSARFQTPFPAYVVARQEIDFDREVRLDDGPITVTINVVRVGRKSLHISETLRSRVGAVHARSLATLVMWDIGTSASRELSAAERAAVEPVPAAETGR